MANLKRKRFRINQDLLVRIKVKTNDELLSLAGRKISVTLSTPLNHVLKVNFDTSGSQIFFYFRGVAQKETGWYTLTVWENRGEVGETAHDICNAFELVSRTCSIEEDNDGLDNSVCDIDAEIEVINKCGIVSQTVRYLDTMTAEEYGQIEHRADTLYIIKLKADDTQRST